jgi:hypothetical protein
MSRFGWIATVTVGLVASGCAALPPETASPAAVVIPAAPRLEDTLGPGVAMSEPRMQLARLQIAAEDTGAHYDRDDWPHWISQGKGCNTRHIVLQRQRADRHSDTGCDLTGGRWVSPYDGRPTSDPTDLQIDHWVPLAEVQRSGKIVGGRRVGPRQWTREQRKQYANDFTVLVAVTASLNGKKNAKDPAKWLPDLDRCGYVQRWIQVKTTYDLSVDQAEHDAMASVLARC